MVACRIHSMRTRCGALKRAYDSGVQADPVHAAEPAVRAQVEVPGDDEHRPDAHEKSAEDDQGVSSAEQERGESSEPAQLAGDSARRDAQERADSAAAPLAAPLAASERLSEPTSELLSAVATDRAASPAAVTELAGEYAVLDQAAKVERAAERAFGQAAVAADCAAEHAAVTELAVEYTFPIMPP